MRSDLEQMKELHRTRDDVKEPSEADKRTELLEWLAFHNPFAREGEATYYVAEVAGKLVAFQGRMPVEFVINGSRVRGYYVHDTYVHPEYRQKGLGFSLITALAQITEQQSESFFCLLGGTPLNLKIQRRMGYQEIPPAPQYVKLLDPHRQLTKLLKLPLLVRLVNPLARILLRLLDLSLFTLNPSGLHIRSVNRFDHRFDLLLDELAGKIGISPAKTSAYLNWRYADRPFKRDTIIVAEDHGKLRGFAVLTINPYRPSSPVGVIVDLLVDPDDRRTVSALCAGAIRYFHRKQVDAISCILTDKRLAKAFGRFLFRRDSSGKAVLLGNLTHSGPHREHLTALHRWHIVRGDSDGFMLSP
jgi:GNAT superfamily N-acetyltransferase